MEIWRILLVLLICLGLLSPLIEGKKGKSDSKKGKSSRGKGKGKGKGKKD